MKYSSLEEIELELAKLSLERQILVEELKVKKYTVVEDLKPYNWMNWMFKIGRKYGVLFLMKKLLK